MFILKCSSRPNLTSQVSSRCIFYFSILGCWGPFSTEFKAGIHWFLLENRINTSCKHEWKHERKYWRKHNKKTLTAKIHNNEIQIFLVEVIAPILMMNAEDEVCWQILLFFVTTNITEILSPTSKCGCYRLSRQKYWYMNILGW